MADRFGQQFIKSLVPDVTILDGYMSAGPDGYVDLTNGTDTLPIWMKSISRTSTGLYVVVMKDTWGDRLFVTVETLGAGATDHLVAHVYSVTTSGFTFVLENSTTGTATDLTTGGGIQFKIIAHNSTAL